MWLSGPFPILKTVTTVDTDLQETITVGSTRRRFTDEYKAEAVQYVVSSGQPVAEVARNLGVVEATLGRWVSKARENGEAMEPDRKSTRLNSSHLGIS